MVFPIAGGNESKGYEISNSLRFNDGDSAYLSRTPSTPTSNDIGTFSFWFKKTNISDLVNIVAAYDGSANNSFDIQFHSDDRLRIRFGNTALHETSTSQLFRDPSAWYHVLFAIDTTQATDSNRIKFYVNGTQITDFNATSYPNQNVDCLLLTGNSHKIGTTYNAGGNMLDGYLTEVYLIDGQALSPTDFGEFDDNGVWIPKKYTGTFGNNGYFLQFKQTGTSQNSSGIGADTSGNDNHFAVTNLAATDVTEDTCTNNFATLNSALADGQFNTSELSEGNTFYNEGQGNNGDGQPTGTFAFNSGKWYWEVQVPSEQNNRAIGFCRMDRVGIDQPPQLHGTGFTATNSVVGINLQDDTIDQVDNAGTHTQHASGLTGMSNNDIFGVAVNLDDGNFQFYRNGSTYGSSYSLSNLSEWQEHGAVPCASGKTYMAYRFNFGNPAFSISSGNSDGKYGNFEYAPPSGYYALCTKRLAEFG